MVVAVIVCVATAGLFTLRFVLRTDRGLQKPKTTNQAEGQVQLLFHKPPRTEQEVAALKKAELGLAEQLMRDFQGNENSLMIMSNVLHRRGNAIEAVKFMNEALKINPNRADAYATMGSLSFDEGKFEQAITQYRKALDIQPQLPGAHSKIGHALMMLGRQDEAIKALQEETQISPSSGLAYFLLGQAYLQQRQYQKAKENYEVAIKIDPEHVNAYYGLATVCAKVGDRDEAEIYSQRFKELKAEARKAVKGRKVEYDDFAVTQKSAAVTYIKAGQLYQDAGELHEAEELLKRAAGLDPENVVCFLGLASLYQKSGQPSKALQMYKKIREIQPESPISYLMIGILSAHLKQLDEAEEAFGKMITLAPKKSDGYRELARLYLKTGRNLRQARQLAARAVALEASAANYFVLAWACDLNGDTAGALPAIERALELEPDNANYLRLYKVIQQRN
ncbi:MAG: tetratricopeptide repeat protein [Phycisphaerales bacterium]|nr:MAG: tetratricopeptide repeat protein [Phycisphaerales bacterium]